MTKAIVDSGALYSLFLGEIGEYLAIKLEEGKEVYFEGAGGRIKAYSHNVGINVNGVVFSFSVAFTEELKISLNILGRDNFFLRNSRLLLTKEVNP